MRGPTLAGHHILLIWLPIKVSFSIFFPVNTARSSHPMSRVVQWLTSALCLKSIQMNPPPFQGPGNYFCSKETKTSSSQFPKSNQNCALIMHFKAKPTLNLSPHHVSVLLFSLLMEIHYLTLLKPQFYIVLAQNTWHDIATPVFQTIILFSSIWFLDKIIKTRHNYSSGSHFFFLKQKYWLELVPEKFFHHFWTLLYLTKKPLYFSLMSVCLYQIKIYLRMTCTSSSFLGLTCWICNIAQNIGAGAAELYQDMCRNKAKGCYTQVVYENEYTWWKQ